MMNIQQRMQRAEAISAGHAARAVRKAVPPTPEPEPKPKANGVGARAWAARRTPYPLVWTLKVLPRDLERPQPLMHAIKRSLFYRGRNPHQVLTVGSMIAVARKPAPRGGALEWFEYVAVDAPSFRNFSYRVKQGKHALRAPKTFSMKFVQTYQTSVAKAGVV
jgi:hypothetical protein